MATYTVKRGDTLYGIARRFETTVDAIVKANSELITNKNRIDVGWVLEIPIKTYAPNTSKPSEPTPKDYEAIGKAVEKCLADIAALPSIDALAKLLD